MLEHVAIPLCYAMERTKSHASWWSVLIHLLSSLLSYLRECARCVGVRVNWTPSYFISYHWLAV